MPHCNFLGDKNCALMLGHYFFLLTLVHEDINLWISCIIDKLYKAGVIERPITHLSIFFYYFDVENYRDHSQYFQYVNDIRIRIWHIPAVLLSWLSIKYHYYLSFEVLIFNSVMLLRSMAFFYSLLCAGDKALYFLPFLKALPIIFMAVHILSEIIQWQLIQQWMNTIIIIDLIIIVLRVSCRLVQSSMDDRPLHVIFALAYGFILRTFCKEYLKDYVDLSKI